MAIDVLSSAGVVINEVDLTPVVRNPSGDNIFITGFTAQGPTDEVVNIGSVSEFESIFGTPTNAAERYLYHTARTILTQSPANLMVTRMPYGTGVGAGFANTYSALVFPVSAAIETITPSYSGNGSTFNTTITSTSSSYVAANYTDANYYQVLAPRSVLLSETQYLDLISNNVTWSTSYSGTSITTASNVGLGGIVVVDSSKVSVNSLYEGYYLALADNSNNNPASDFTCISGVQAVNTVVNGTYQTFTSIPTSRLNFQLTQKFTAPGRSISQLIEQNPNGYDFAQAFYNDCLTLMVFKIRTSVYAQDTVILDYTPISGSTGSLYANKFQNSGSGGPPVTFSLEKIVSNQTNSMKMLVNPFISNTGNWVGSDGAVLKKVRVASEAQNLFSQGVFIADTDISNNELGNVPAKLQTVLNRLEDREVDIDLLPEAGLGTVWAGSSASRDAVIAAGGTYASDAGYFFDDKKPISAALIAELRDQSGNITSSLNQNYQSVIQQLYTFAEKTRKDHMFIADPLRYIFVNGPDTKVNKVSTYNFSSDVYWALRNLYGAVVSSYGAAYANWIKANDTTSNQLVWLPSSGWAAANIAYASAISFPWVAPAGFNRGILANVIDVAINPTQKQRDLLARISINPIAFFQGDGYVIYGQQTLLNKISAFNRINVRRLFLTLEKNTKELVKYYVFENNTYTTRLRLKNALTPLFNSAKLNDGCYDYEIVCDERNNTPNVIDNNELKVACYIEPVRTGERILVDFIGTPTGTNFAEIIG